MSNSQPPNFESLDPSSHNPNLLIFNDSLFDGLRGSNYGDFTTRTKGFGVETYAHRPYEMGDDPRVIDRRASARMPDGSLIVREHFKDITPKVWLVSDTSSLDYESGPLGLCSIRELGRSVLSVLATSLESKGKSVNLLLSSQNSIYSNDKERKSNVSEKHLGSVFDRLKEDKLINLEDGESLASALAYLGKISFGNLVVIVSAFDSQGWQDQLPVIMKDNNVLAIRLFSPSRYELPNSLENLGSINRPKTNIGNFDKKDQKKIREKYKALAQAEDARVVQTFDKLKIPHISLGTDTGTWFSDLVKKIKKIKK